MIVILDVSAAMEILLQREKKEQFEQLYQTASWVIAPDLYVSEIANVLWKYARANLFSQADCLQYTDDGIAMIDDFIDARQLWQEALEAAIMHNHSVYDLLYAIFCSTSPPAQTATSSKSSTNLKSRAMKPASPTPSSMSTACP